MLQVLQCSGFSGPLTHSPCSACSRFSCTLCSLVLSLSHCHSKSSACGSKLSSALGSLMLSLSHHAQHHPGSPVLWFSSSLAVSSYKSSSALSAQVVARDCMSIRDQSILENLEHAEYGERVIILENTE